MLDTALSPCCRSYPAGVVNRVSQRTIDHAAFVLRERTRPPELSTSRGHLCVHLRYGPVTRSPPFKVVLSMGFRPWVSRRPAIHATGCLTFPQVGLTPTDDISLHWTHSRTVGFPESGWQSVICMRYLPKAFPQARRWKCTPTYTPHPHSLLCGEPAAQLTTVARLGVLHWCHPYGRSLYREPLCLFRALPLRVSHGLGHRSP